MDQLALAHRVLACARAKAVLITTAESCTGGLLAAAITGVAGSSQVFERGYVTYSDGAKVDLLGVGADTLNRFGAVSEDVAREMAGGALAGAGADIALAVTGITGPGASAHKPEGRVCFALAQSGRAVISETVEFSAIGRAQVRNGAVGHALEMLLARLA